MKIRTTEQLQAALDADLTWRKRELLVLRELAMKARDHEKPSLQRALIAMSYAHWEGFVKYSIEALLTYVRLQGLRYRQVNYALVGMALAARLRQLTDTQKYRPFGAIAQHIYEMDEEKCSLPQTVSTRSNLSSTVFDDLLAAIGLEASEISRRSSQFGGVPSPVENR